MMDRLPAGASAKLDYVTARNLAADPDPLVRHTLAANEGVPPEILYFLAEDPELTVRLAVAANDSCPAKGNLLLADDPDGAVRAALASKMGRRRQSRRGGVTDRILHQLAGDQIAQVRTIIAVALKDVADADSALINRLARDTEIIVAAPILEFSPVLTNADLLEIIAGNPVRGALSAIARRAYVDTAVTTAIVESNDSVAITHMLKNGNAHLQENVLDALIEKSAHEPMWQEPLVYRPELKQHSALRLAELVAVHLLDRILARKDLAPDTVQAVAKVVGERLRQQSTQVETGPVADTVEQRYAARLERARTQYAKGLLDEVTLMVMLLADPADEMVVALAARSGLAVTAVQDIVESGSPLATCALSWAAGLSAVFAAELQARLAGLPLAKVLRPAADGSYAVKESELRWQLEMFANTDGPKPA